MSYWEPITIHLLNFLVIFIRQRSDVISLRETPVDCRQYNTKPASQNKTERCFSAASHVMTDRWTMLDPEHLEQGHREFPFWKSKIPPPAPCKNSRKFPLSNTPLCTLFANINLTKSHYLSIAMSNVNSLRLSPSIKSTNSSNRLPLPGGQSSSTQTNSSDSDSDSDCLPVPTLRAPLSRRIGRATWAWHSD